LPILCGGYMIKFNFFWLAAFIILLTPSQTLAQAWEAPKDHPVRRVASQAISQMDKKYRRLPDGRKLEIKDIHFIVDDALFLSAELPQMCPKCGEKEAAAILDAWMFVLAPQGVSQLPIYVRLNAPRTRRLLAEHVAGQERGWLDSPVPDAFAGGLSHEMEHVLNQAKKADEAKCRKIEVDTFSFSSGRFLNTPWYPLVDQYRSFLKGMVQGAVKEK
jgi:hypothetical protein